MVGLLMGSSLVHDSARFASFVAWDSEKFPFRFLSMKSLNLHTSVSKRREFASLRVPERIWNMMTPNAYMSLFSVKRPIVMYSGARYPMAALVLRDEKIMSSARSLERPESEINALN